MRKIKSQADMQLCLLVVFIFKILSVNTINAQSSPVLIGSIGGKFEISQSGAATYSMPIAVAPGTAGMVPKLSLNYSSDGGKGIFGMGWGLSGLSTIARCAASIAQDGYNHAVNFASGDRLCLDGQKMLAFGSSPGAYWASGTEYRSEKNPFDRIVQSGNGSNIYFTVYAKDGTVLEYGNGDNSRLYGQSAANVVSWGLNKVTDRSGNYMTVTYFHSVYPGMVPLQIDYTGNAGAGLLPYNSVRFEYENTPASVQYIGGEGFLLAPWRMKYISIYKDQSKAWYYDFTYENENVTHQDRLISVQECDGQSVCLPATHFTWGADNLAALEFTTATHYSDMASGQGYLNDESYPLFTGDWNGDGKTDIARIGTSGIKTCLASGVGQFSSCQTILDFYPPGYTNTNTYPLVVGDWNGDGNTDFGRVSDTDVLTYISNGDGTFYLGIPFNNMSPSQNYPNSATYPILTGDWNGDGKTDLARIGTAGVKACLSVGNGQFNNCHTLVDFRPPGYTSTDTYPVVTGDWNGDGLTDIARVSDTHVLSYVSNGDATFTQITPFSNLSPSQGYSNANTYPMFSGDWNGDGKTDIARVADHYVFFYVSNGGGFQLFGSINAFGAADGFTSATSNPIVIGDFNGDGRTDLARVSANKLITYVSNGDGVFSLTTDLNDLSPAQGFLNTNTYPVIEGDWNGDGKTDIARVADNSIYFYPRALSQTTLLQSISDGFGKQTQITYGLLTDNALYTKNDSSIVYPYPGLLTIQPPMQVVSSFSTSDGLGGMAGSHIHYTGLRFDQSRRQLTGFGSIDTIDDQSAITSSVYYWQHFPYEGIPYLQFQKQPDGTMLSLSSSAGAMFIYSNQSFFPYISTTTDYSYELNGSLTGSSVTNYSYDNNYGNLLQTVVTRSDGSGETTTNTYNNDVTNWLLGQILTSSVTKTAGGLNPAPPVTRSTSFSYQAGTGLLLTETIEPGNSQYNYIKSYTYDVFGNIVQTTLSGSDFQTRTTSSQYDGRGQFAIQVTNALGQSETRQYDDSHGVVISSTGPNGITNSWTFDSFGRPTGESHADGTVATTSYHAADANSPVNTAYFIRKDISGAAPSMMYYDVLGREIRRETLGFNGQQLIVDKIYDNQGRVAQVSDPYFMGDPVLWSVSSYDLIGRVTTLTTPGNIQTSMSYLGLTSSTVNDLGQIKSQTVDQQGRVVSVTDNLGFTLTTKRDSYGNPIEITDSVGNVTTIQYDLAGRKISMTDPDTGTSTYTYDKLGQMLSQTNALGQTTSYTYDKLGRVLSRTRVEGVETWLYDSSAYGIGKLSQVVGLSGYSESYLYDALGRLIRTSTTIGGSTYSFDQTYDQFGRVESLMYPSGFALNYDYNTSGYLSSIKNGNYGVVWQGDVRNARGQLEQQTLGNGLVTTQTFNANTGLIQSIQTGNVQNLSFTFDSLGNLTSRQDLIAGRSESFAYDGLNRLIQSQVLGQAPVTVSYDSIGNILSRSDVGNYLYGQNGAGPHAVTSISGTFNDVYGYDATGNRIEGQNGKLQYTSTGKPYLIVKGGSELQFDHDPSDQRFEERRFENGGLAERKLFLGGGMYEVVEKGSSVSEVHYIKGGEGPVAIYTSTNSKKTQTDTIQYLLHDHLGSIQTITDKGGKVVEVNSFDSWGLRRDPVTWGPATNPIMSLIDRGYTGHEQLDSVGLIHMNGRVYDPTIGRFISADPVVQDSSDMQAYNRYTYVRNNPLSLTDPSGYSWFSKKRIQRFFHKAVKIGAVVGAFVIGTALAQPWTSYALVAGGFLSSVTSAKISGASNGQALLSGLRSIPISLVLAASANQIGGVFNDGLLKASAHGLSNGIVSQATGGEFKSGFVAGLAGDLGAGSSYLNAMLIGGTASALAGGKFDEGAIRGAFIYMYNHLEHSAQRDARNVCTENGTRWMAISSTNHFNQGTVGAAVNKAVSGLHFLIGDIWSGDIGYHYLELESQRLMSEPATAANLLSFARRETLWWAQQPGAAGAFGRSISASGRFFILNSIANPSSLRSDISGWGLVNWKIGQHY